MGALIAVQPQPTSGKKRISKLVLAVLLVLRHFFAASATIELQR